MATSTVAAPLRLLTEDEVAAFHADGATIIKGVLSEEWVALLEQGIEEAKVAPDHRTVDSDLDEFRIRIDQFPAARSPMLRRFIDESPVAAVVGQAMRAPVAFYMDQMFCKPAGHVSNTPWHQDTSYYNIEGHNLVRAWVSPDPVPRSVSLEVVRGSHRWGVDYSPLNGRDPRTDPEAGAIYDRMIAGDWPDHPHGFGYADAIMDPQLPAVPDIAGHLDSYTILGWDYEPGDVILFHGDILHGAAGGVKLETQRRAHASMWAGPDMRFTRRVSQNIADPVDLLAAGPRIGQPLSDFPDVFPIKWAP